VSSESGATHLPENCKANNSAKFALSLDLVTKFHNTIIFSTSNATLAQRFLGIQRNQRCALFQRRRLCNDVFSTLADEFGGFGAVFETALKERKQEIGYKKHGGISAYRKGVFVILTMNF